MEREGEREKQAKRRAIEERERGKVRDGIERER